MWQVENSLHQSRMAKLDGIQMCQNVWGVLNLIFFKFFIFSNNDFNFGTNMIIGQWFNKFYQRRQWKTTKKKKEAIILSFLHVQIFGWFFVKITSHVVIDSEGRKCDSEIFWVTVNSQCLIEIVIKSGIFGCQKQNFVVSTKKLKCHRIFWWQKKSDGIGDKSIAPKNEMTITKLFNSNPRILFDFFQFHRWKKFFFFIKTRIKENFNVFQVKNSIFFLKFDLFSNEQLYQRRFLIGAYFYRS